MKLFILLIFINLNAFEGKNIKVQNCALYPYVGIQNHVNGNARVQADINKAHDGLNQCLMMSVKSHEYLKIKFKKLTDILSSNQVKTFTCIYGQFNSFNAFASFHPDHRNSYQNERYGIKSHPEILLDINRMAGNFPLDMDESKKKDFLLFYKDKIKFEDIIPGKRNPFLSRVENPVSLLAHEMIHWTGFYHSEDRYPDFAYLAQMCCFPIKNVKEIYRKQACEFLYNEDLWQGNKQLLERREIFKKVGQLVRKLRTVI